MTNSFTTVEGVTISGEFKPQYAEILTAEAIEFISKLHRKFNQRRLDLLARRQKKQAEIDNGVMPDFLVETESVRESEWQVADTPDDLQKRWVEITGPTDRKMMINALNSGADVFMADLEDSNSPSWHNVVEGQINLRDAVQGTISFVNPDGKSYELENDIATLMLRPRGWHLVERHMVVDDEPVSGALFDFGLYFFHNAQQLINNASGPYFYLAKLENHLEARLWNDVFNMAQDELHISRGTVRATVLLETILAAFEMEEILYELREHSAGMNAGRWDYIFSAIKKFRNQPDVLFPDRAQITMTVPFMRTYTELLVRSCHKRRAHVIGGMAAFIPSRTDEKINENAFAKVREDKEREVNDGFDGTWVAHPDLVPVARAVFAEVLDDAPHQKKRLREDVQVSGSNLLNFKIAGGEITEEGLRLNINVGIWYLAAWLSGTGAAAIYNLMEDTATAEISRAQVWQWINNDSAQLADGRPIDAELYHSLVPSEMMKIKHLVGETTYQQIPFLQARQLFDQFATEETFTDFLTLIAYNYLK